MRLAIHKLVTFVPSSQGSILLLTRYWTRGECDYSYSLYSFQATQLVFPRTLENTVKGILLQKENKMLIFRRPAEFEFSRSSSEHYDTASKPSGYSSVIVIVIARCWIIWITMLSPGCFSHSAGEKWTFPLKESDHKNKQVIYIRI